MRWIPLLVAASTALLAGHDARAGADLSGLWEIQSMGADRKVELKQKGAQLTAHRVMWPEFEGEKYKLEHLYRGRIQGGEIKGQLLVREEEVPAYEALRPFAGRISSPDEIILDGLPLKRTGGASPGGTPEPPPTLDRPEPPPSFARVARPSSPLGS